MGDGDDTVFLRVRVLKAGDASLFVEGSEGDSFGVPRSQVREHPGVVEVIDEAGDEGILCIPRWLAEDREVEYVEDHDEA